MSSAKRVEAKRLRRRHIPKQVRSVWQRLVSFVKRAIDVLVPAVKHLVQTIGEAVVAATPLVQRIQRQQLADAIPQLRDGKLHATVDLIPPVLPPLRLVALPSLNLRGAVS